MRKIMVFLKRRTDLDRPAFFAWWLNDHRPLVEKIPGLKRYTISLQADGEDGAFDGVAELWFDDAAAAERGFASDEAARAGADTRAHASRRERLDLVEHKFIDTGAAAPFKLVSALKRRAGLTRPQFKDWWLQRHAPMVKKFPELRRYQVDLVEDGPEGFADGIAELNFADLDTLRRVTGSTQVKDVQKDSVVHADGLIRLFVREHPVF